MKAYAHTGIIFNLVAVLAFYTGTLSLYSCEPATPQKESRFMREDTFTPRSQSPLSWDSPKMGEIRNKWKLINEEYEKTPLSEKQEKYGGKNEKYREMIITLLEKNLSMQDLRDLATTSATLPFGREHVDHFLYDVFEHMIDLFIEAGEREGLVRLFINHFVQRIGLYYDIEYALVLRNKLKDPITILGEAYDKCRDDNVKAQIAIAIRRAFTPSGIHGKDDDEFVKNAMLWYEKNKKDLVVNPKYIDKNVSIDPELTKNPTPLFVQKPINQNTKGGK